MPKCELLIIMGTSLVVHPVAGLIREVDDDVPRLLINLTPAGEGGSGGMAFGRSDNARYADIRKGFAHLYDHAVPETCSGRAHVTTERGGSQSCSDGRTIWRR